MKTIRALLLLLAVGSVGFGKDIFVAQGKFTLTQRECVWRVEETRQGLRVRFGAPKMAASSEIAGPEAQALRAKIAGLRLSPADIAALHAREYTRNGEIILRPFDGILYKFAIGGGELIVVPNPSYDLEHHAELAETVRLREVIDLLRELERIAKKEGSASNP